MHIQLWVNVYSPVYWSMHADEPVTSYRFSLRRHCSYCSFVQTDYSWVHLRIVSLHHAVQYNTSKVKEFVQERSWKTVKSTGFQGYQCIRFWIGSYTIFVYAVKQWMWGLHIREQLNRITSRTKAHLTPYFKWLTICLKNWKVEKLIPADTFIAANLILKKKCQWIFSPDTELKWSIVAYNPSSSLSINLQLLCFMSKVWCWCGPIRHACSMNL